MTLHDISNLPPRHTNGVERLQGLLSQLVSVVLGLLLTVMAMMIAYQVISRYVFNAPSSVTEEFLRYSLIWLGILGAGQCFLLDKHLNLPLLLDLMNPINAQRVEVFNATLVLIFGMLMTWGGYLATVSNVQTLTPMMRLSVGGLQSVLMVTGMLICVSQLTKLICLISRRSGNAVNLLGAIAILVVTSVLVVLFRGSETYAAWVDNHIELFSLLVLFGAFFLLLGLGVPIAVGLAISGILTLSLQIDLDVLFATMGEKMFNGLDSFGFLALPFFVLAGAIMNEAGIARRLIDFAMLIGKRIPGSLWQTNVLANMMFGTLSGSGIAAATAIGGLVAPIAREKGYDMPFTTAVNAASAPSGMLIPPSGVLIVYSLITGGSASVVALFLAGYLPGIIMGLCVMMVAYFYAKRHNYPVDRSPTSLAEVRRVAVRTIPSLMLVVVVIGGIISGVFTATEGSGVAVLYALTLALLYRGLSVESVMRILRDTALASGVILFLIACSNLMSWSMTFASIPDTVGLLLTGLSDNRYVLLLAINLMLLVVGTFMDMSPALLIFTPILFPVVTELGVDPVHFGVILVYNLSMGVVTPPVGTVLFVSCGVTGEKVTKVVGPLMPIFALQMAGLMLVTYVPFLSLALPRLFGL